MTTSELDALEVGALAIIKIGTVLDPQLSWTAPFIASYIKLQFHRVRSGIGDGTIVPDGAGGFVPNTNSRVMPDGSLRPYNPAIDNSNRRNYTGL